MKRIIFLLLLVFLPLISFAQQPKWHLGGRMLTRTVTHKIVETSTKIETEGTALAVAGGVIGQFMKLTGEFTLPANMEKDGLDYDYSSYSFSLDFFKRIDLILPFIGLKAEFVDQEFNNDVSITGFTYGLNGGLSFLFPSFLIDFYYSTNLTNLEKKDVIEYESENQLRIGASYVF